MSPPAVAAVIVAVALGTLLFFLYGNQTGDQQEPEQEQVYSYSNIRNRDSNRPSNNVRRSTRWSDDDECTICYTPLRSESCMTLACSHSYHKKCIERWKHVSSGSPSCPICRHKF